MTASDPYREIMTFIDGGEHFLVSTHMNPDGDGVGSMLALAKALEACGKKVTLTIGDPVPDSLVFLPRANTIRTDVPSSETYDAAIMVDCAEPARAGKAFAEKVKGMKMAVIDHHLYSGLEGALMCLDSDAASTGEVIWRLLGRMGVERDKDVAICIYTTLVVDTGFFRYSNTTSAVLALAAELVAAGADPWTVARNLDESYPPHRLQLLGASLASLEISRDGAYASMDVTAPMLQTTGASIGDSDEFATYPRSIKSVEVAALFREVGDGKVKVSLRSKEFVNVADIARTHGGGGHMHAAGFTLAVSLAEAKEIVRKDVEKALLSFRP